MKGEEVKKILENDGLQLTDVAEKLNISPQNFNNWLGVQDIKTGVLEKIALAIDKNIYYFIDKQSLVTQERDEFHEEAIRYYDVEASAGSGEMFDPGKGIKFKILPDMVGFYSCSWAPQIALG